MAILSKFLSEVELLITTNMAPSIFEFFIPKWLNKLTFFSLFYLTYLQQYHEVSIRILVMAMQDSPIVPVGRSPQTDVLLKAENAVLEVGGCVLRLAGLYISSLVSFSKKIVSFIYSQLETVASHVKIYFNGVSLPLAVSHKSDRGAHVYWLKKGIVDARLDHILNLIHYEVIATSPFSFILIDNAQINYVSCSV